jgi:hypothetical protein
MIGVESPIPAKTISYGGVYRLSNYKVSDF